VWGRCCLLSAMYMWLSAARRAAGRAAAVARGAVGPVRAFPLAFRLLSLLLYTPLYFIFRELQL
jgi:hypothetical protein